MTERPVYQEIVAGRVVTHMGENDSSPERLLLTSAKCRGVLFFSIFTVMIIISPLYFYSFRHPQGILQSIIPPQQPHQAGREDAVRPCVDATAYTWVTGDQP